MPINQSRWLSLDGTRNCRDLGGIAVRDGETKFAQLIRSDALHELSNNDLEHLERLGLGAIIDLRVQIETSKAPNNLSPSLKKKQKNLAFLPNQTLQLLEMVNKGELTGTATYRLMLEQYRILALEHTADYRSIIAEIVRYPDNGVLFHCTSGKDRTGMVSAILLAIVGASEEAIIADYEMTNGRIKPISYLEGVVDVDVINRIMAADPDYMYNAFDAMKKEFGSVGRYLEVAVGVSQQIREELMTKLLV